MAHPRQPRPAATNIPAAVGGEGEGTEGSPLPSETLRHCTLGGSARAHILSGSMRKCLQGGVRRSYSET